MDKVCKICKITFYKKKNRSLESWSNAKYCSVSCCNKDQENTYRIGRLVSGLPAWNSGMRGRKPWMNTSGLSAKGSIPWNKGKTGIYSEESLEKNRLKHIGISPPNKGIPMSDEQKLKCSISGRKRKGDRAGGWKGGITPKNTLIRSSIEYKLWRKSVFERDNFSCIFCGARGVLNADHIKPFASYPELRFAIDNGRTLCVPCHKKTPTYGNRKCV